MGELHCIDHLYQTNTLCKTDRTQTDLLLRWFVALRIYFYSYLSSSLYSIQEYKKNVKHEKKEGKKIGYINRRNNVFTIDIYTSIINVSN